MMMANIIAALVCFIMGMFMFYIRRMHLNKNDLDITVRLMRMYITHLKTGGIMCMLLGLSFLVDLLNYL